MIKRLFRKKLRHRLLSYHRGASEAQYEKIFNWVYKAPIWDWECRISCMYEAHVMIKKGADWIPKAEELYRLLCK